ncbi:Hsp70 family protein [Leptolyngbya sp. FACHB-17]|uniref:Hsp70 family protein n=1 Tax=unclassified Leptolyngbya TaxID=2650499 RepID=UPI00168041F7|nr:Hsp70 family protein [Leptolyngbya sp. FACHB-17]MBD2078927.1 Hsp70 family protein [Leptolyngbya sp. FACHB-17]
MTAVAIDFGTSNTVVSVLEPDTQAPMTLRVPEISRWFNDVAVVPSLVFVQGQGEFVVGEPVRSQRLGLTQPQRFFRSFKRDLTADFQPPARTLDGQVYDAEAIAVQFLSEIWQAIKAAQIQPSLLIFTVPVGAFERYLNWFQDVALKFGFPDVKFVDESTAAALGYAVDRPGSTVLVADFGGGTLDLSLVRTSTMASGQKVLQAEVLAKSDAYIGGEDLDRWIVEHYLQQMNTTREAIGEMGWQNVLSIAEQLKIRLSSAEEAKESWFDEENFIYHDLILTRSQFEDLLEARQLLEQVRQAIDETLQLGLRKGVQKSDIEQVLLVGGSCQIRAIQQLFMSYFGRQRVQVHKPFEAVAHGALALTQIAGLEDYLRHGYAIRLWEPYSRSYTYFPLFEPGTKYPCKREEPLTLQAALEGQTEIRLDIGEVAQVTEAEVTYDAQGRMSSTPLRPQETYRSLAHDRNQICVARLDPPGKLGVDRISVELEVTEQRILTATIRDLLTQKVLLEQGAIAKLS